MVMKQSRKQILLWTHAYCDNHDKSTGFMIEFMIDHLQQNEPKLDYYEAHNIVMDYLMRDLA